MHAHLWRIISELKYALLFNRRNVKLWFYYRTVYSVPLSLSKTFTLLKTLLISYMNCKLCKKNFLFIKIWIPAKRLTVPRLISQKNTSAAPYEKALCLTHVKHWEFIFCMVINANFTRKQFYCFPSKTYTCRLRQRASHRYGSYAKSYAVVAIFT